MKPKRAVRRTAAVLCVMGAALCCQAETEVALPQMTYEEFPKMDGSLACVPMMEALGQKITGCTEIQAEHLLDDFSNTNPCYLALAEGKRDFCIAYEPAEETVKELTAYDPLTMTSIGRDALVFLVNRDNPVESITVEQAHDIFTGKITNWKELGGEDTPIAVFTRPETSGSQTLMRKLLIGDEEMPDKQTTMVESMEGIIEAIRDYDNSASAIGYSVYYYASAMFGQPDLKFLKIEDTAPENGTISDGTYPLVNDFYCVTREDSPENAKAISAWLESEEGQKFVEECGYVPVEINS